jgi:hypothetical protein
MGSSHALCGLPSDKENTPPEIKERHFHNSDKQPKLSNIKVTYCRATFLKICPISIREEEIVGEEYVATEGSEVWDLVEMEGSEKKENPAMSLEDILFEEEKKSNFSRIGVNWQSFIKIKKKNYLEDYIFIKEIGKGAFGSVLKIKMKYGGLFRAAKVIKSALISKEKSNCGKLFAEISVPIKLDHPNLAKLFEVFEHRGQYVLVM